MPRTMMSTGAQLTVAGSLGTATSLMVSPGAELNALTLHAGILLLRVHYTRLMSASADQ